MFYTNGSRNAGQRFVEEFLTSLASQQIDEVMSLYLRGATLNAFGKTWKGRPQIRQFYTEFLTDLRVYDLVDADPYKQTKTTAAFEVVIIKSDMAVQMLNNIVLQSDHAYHHTMIQT